MMRATPEEITALLGEHVDESIAERIAATGASIDEIGEAIDDLDYERSYGEPRESSSSRIEEVRTILEELSAKEAETPTETDSETDEEYEGLTVVERDDFVHDA